MELLILLMELARLILLWTWDRQAAYNQFFQSSRLIRLMEALKAPYWNSISCQEKISKSVALRWIGWVNIAGLEAISDFVYDLSNYTGWKNITDQLSLRSIVLNILTTGINDCNSQNSLDYFVNTIRIIAPLNCS